MKDENYKVDKTKSLENGKENLRDPNKSLHFSMIKEVKKLLPIALSCHDTEND